MDDNFEKYLERVRALSPEEKAKIKDRLVAGISAPRPNPTYVHGTPPKGLKEPGNVDLNNRPVIKNSDGSNSTEFSISFGNDKGEVLIPTVVNGKFLSVDGKKPVPGSTEETDMFNRARQHYEASGEHMGVFDTPDNATAYADAVHNRNQEGPSDAGSGTGGQ